MGNNMNQQPKNNSKMLSYLAVAVILILLYLYITKPTQTTVVQTNSTQNNSEYQSILQSNSQLQQQNQKLNSQLQQANSQLQQSQINQRTPIVTTLYSNDQITLLPLNSSIQFYNSTYGLYNNYTTASFQNFTFNVKYDGYIIINIQNVLQQYSSNPPQIGTFGVQVHSQSIETYYSSIIRVPTCTYTVGYGSYCPNEKAITLGYGLYPVNYSASYLAPVSRGNTTISFSNFNNYPLNLEFSVTYVGENDTNLIPLTENYSTV